MKLLSMRLLGVLVFLSLSFTYLIGQDLDLPRKSPKASTSYTLGYTEITINYSSPSVKGREIWGALEPWDKIWRAGANEATTIEFSTDVKIGREKKELPAGKYSFFVIPKEEGKWTAIFNKDTELWGAYEYDEKQDAARIEVSPRMKGKKERLEYNIVDQGLDRGYILLSWEKLKLVVYVTTPAYTTMKEKVAEAVEAAPAEKKGGIYASAADVLIDLDDKRSKQAMKMIEKSIEMEESSYNHWVKAKIHAADKNYKEAVETGKKALEIGAAKKEDRFYNYYKDNLEQTLVKWEAMIK